MSPRHDPVLGRASGSSTTSAAGGQRRSSGLVGLLLRDQAANPLGEQDAVERLLEGVVEAEAVDFLARLAAGQGHQDRLLVVLAAAEVLGDLAGLDPADVQVDNDAIRVEALGADAGLESRGGRL